MATALPFYSPISPPTRCPFACRSPPLDAALKGLRARGPADEHDLHVRLTRMVRQTSDLMRILDDMKLYAKSTPEHRRPESLADLAAESHATALDALKADARGLEKVRVQFDIERRVSLVCDRNQIVRALANIIKNAYEAHSPAPFEFRSGEVRINARRVDAEHVQFIVADTGMGIAADELDAVLQFVPGNTSKKATGTGFGLPIARRMIERHGGSLAIESCDDVGTEVAITMPVKQRKEDHVPCVGG